MTAFRVCLAQINPTLGDFSGNVQLICHAARDARARGAQLVAFPEMALTGYPIEDLATDPDFLRTATEALNHLATQLEQDGCGDLIILVGYPAGPLPSGQQPPASPTAIAENRAAVLQHGTVVGEYTKHHLPNYAVFDEFRNFIPGNDPVVLQAGDTTIGLIICEDLWRPAGPLDHLTGADLVVVLNASPYAMGKFSDRVDLIRTRVAEVGAPLAYVNLVGGQDDLVFDGASLVMDAAGTIVAQSPSFQEDLLLCDVPSAHTAGTVAADVRIIPVDLPEPAQEVASAPAVTQTSPERTSHTTDSESLRTVWEALVTGLRDYVDKNHFSGVVLGLSGGIDSSLVAALAADALGAERVYGVLMPSRYSSDHSLDDAKDLVARTGIHARTEPITALVPAFETQLHLTGVAAENLQARIRGIILMAISNSEGQLVLTTGNKSELAVGYSTIYGDAVGGFNPIKDVLKTLVWDLSRWRNANATAHGTTPPIPERVIVKPPSAELRPDQTDQDSLPPYPELDDIIHRYVELREGPTEIMAAGHRTDTVSRIIALIDRAEWKRRQAAPGTRITELAFGRDRRIPITNRRPHVTRH